MSILKLKNVNVSVRVTEETRRAIRIRANAKNISQSDYLTNLVELEVRRSKRK